MNYFKSPENGEVFAYDDEQVAEEFVIPGLVAMTQEEVSAHLYPPKTSEQLREEWKATRSAAVAAIKVTTQAGHVFDGDEESQGRMARAILGLQAVPGGRVTWVLADNTVQSVGAAELTEALVMAGEEQARLWVAE